MGSRNPSADISFNDSENITVNQHKHVHHHAPGVRGSLPEDFCSREIYATRNFTGRSDVFEQVSDLLKRDGFAAICGLPGNGKSTLAREYGWRRRNVNTVIWLNAESEASIISTFLHLDRELNLLPSGYAQNDAHDTALYIRRILLEEAKKPLLLIFDNLEKRNVFEKWSDHQQIASLITSRKVIWREQTIDLESFLPDEAIAYLKAESHRNDIPDSDARELCEVLGCHPLALSHTAAYLRAKEAVPLRKYLERIIFRLGEDANDVESSRAVFATFREAISQVENIAPGSISLLCLSAFLMPEAIPQEIYEQSSDAYPEAEIRFGSLYARSLKSMIVDGEVEQALSALHQYSLIHYFKDERTFSLHRLVQRSVEQVLGEESRAWNYHAIRALYTAFHRIRIDFTTWSSCDRLIQHARCALGRVPSSECDESLASLAMQCGYYLCERFSFSHAEPLYRRALVISEKVLGVEHPDVALSLNNLALLLRSTHRYDEAEPLFKRALGIFEKVLGAEHPDVAHSLNNLAFLLDSMHRHDEAEPLCWRALGIREKVLGVEHPDVASSLNNLAALLYATHRSKEAEPLYRRALGIFEKVLGVEHPDVAQGSNNLALLLASIHRYDEAEPLYRRALGIREKVFGVEHPDVAQSLNNLAALLDSTQRYNEAEALYRRALKIYEAHYDDTHPNVVFVRQQLANLLNSH